MNTRRFTCVSLISILILVLSGCYPSGPSEVGDRDLVITAFDEDEDFGAIRTYAMPDEVFDRESSDDDRNTEFDPLILNAVARNMAAVGYVREMNPQANGADVVVLVSAAQNTSSGWVSIPWWPIWGGWPGWGGWCCYGPGWGIGYPWVIPVSVTTGTIFVEMFDPNNPQPTEQLLPASWGAVMNGLAGDGSGVDRINRAVDQAFAQSPYLGAN